MGTEYRYMFKNDEEKLQGAKWVEENTDIGGMHGIPLTAFIGVCTCANTHTVFPVMPDLNRLTSDVELDTIEEFAVQVFILTLEK